MADLKPKKQAASKGVAINSLAASYIELLRLRDHVEELEAKAARFRTVGAASAVTVQPDLPV